MNIDLGSTIFLLLIFSIMVTLCSHIICLVRLRVKHYEVWQRLGRPSVLRQQLEFFLPLLTFFYRGRFRQLGDPVLSLFAWLRVIFDVIGIGIFVLIFINEVARLHLFG